MSTELYQIQKLKQKITQLCTGINLITKIENFLLSILAIF